MYNHNYNNIESICHLNCVFKIPINPKLFFYKRLKNGVQKIWYQN